jgi:hypothetical protein
MGFYDVVCGISEVSLLGQEADLILVRETKKGWRPVGLAVRGTYNRLGSIDVSDSSWTKTYWSGVQKLLASKKLELDEEAEDLEEFFACVERTAIGENCVRFEGEALGFMLIQADVCDALIETAEEEGTQASDLEDLPVEDLVARAFQGVEPGPSLVKVLTANRNVAGKAKDELVRLLQIQAWMAKHKATWGVSDEAGQHGGEEIEESLAKAKKHFAKAPLLLAAVERCRENVADLIEDEEE